MKKIYIYYSIGNGNHESTDDVAIIRAWTLKQAKKILKKYVNIENLDNYELYRLRWFGKYNNKKIKFISYY